LNLGPEFMCLKVTFCDDTEFHIRIGLARLKDWDRWLIFRRKLARIRNELYGRIVKDARNLLRMPEICSKK